MPTWDHGVIASLFASHVVTSCTMVFLLALHLHCRAGKLGFTTGEEKAAVGGRELWNGGPDLGVGLRARDFYHMSLLEEAPGLTRPSPSHCHHRDVNQQVSLAHVFPVSFSNVAF